MATSKCQVFFRVTIISHIFGPKCIAGTLDDEKYEQHSDGGHSPLKGCGIRSNAGKVCSRPKEYFTKVIGMGKVFPESHVTPLIATVWEFFEIGLLLIGNGFE